MITTNVIQRTFHIRFGDSTGTAFAIDRDNRQYLVTARHVVENITSGNSVLIFHERQWKNTSVEVIGIGAGENDVAVLACPVRLAPSHPLESSSAGLTYGQPVYFLGFPFGWDGGGEQINRDFPIPFVKAGIVSSITFGYSSRIYIDGHNNKGFSGGPLVYVPTGQPSNDFRVAGVVANYPAPIVEAVVDRNGRPILGANNQPIAYFKENQGFVVAFDIRHVTELVDANPKGFKLPPEQDR